MSTLGKPALLAALLTAEILGPGRAFGAGWPGNLTVTAAGTVNRVDNLSRTSTAPTRAPARRT